MNLSPQLYYGLAILVGWFHFFFVIAMCLGCVALIPSVVYAKRKITGSIIIPGFFMVLTNTVLGECPLTLLERWLLWQVDPQLVYSGSFLANLFNRYLNVHVSEWMVTTVFLVAISILFFGGMLIAVKWSMPGILALTEKKPVT